MLHLQHSPIIPIFPTPAFWLEEVEVLVLSPIIGNLLLYHLWVSTAPLNHIRLLLPTLKKSFCSCMVIQVILGDFNIHLDKPQAADFHTLLVSFDLKRVLTTATHKSGNQLDLINTRHCSTDHMLATPLHTSDHFLLTLNLNMINHKILLNLIYMDHSSMTSLLMSPLLKGDTILTKLTIRLTLACSLKKMYSFVLLLSLLHQL